MSFLCRVKVYLNKVPTTFMWGIASGTYWFECTDMWKLSIVAVLPLVSLMIGQLVSLREVQTRTARHTEGSMDYCY